MSFCNAVRAVRAGVAALFRGAQLRRAGLLSSWRGLAGELALLEERGGLEERGRERLELLERLLEDAGAAGAAGAGARAALELALRGSAGGLLEELRPPRLTESDPTEATWRAPGASPDPGELEELEELARVELARLERALLAGLAAAPPGSARCQARTRLEERLLREGEGALLARDPAGGLAGELARARGWLAALLAGLEDLLRGRELEELRREERARAAAGRSCPALPLALLQAGEDLLLLPRRIVPARELAALTAGDAGGGSAPGALAVCWLAGAGAAGAYAAPAVPEELLRAGGSALAGCAGDLLLRLVVRSAAAAAAAGCSPDLLRWRGGLAGLAAALAGCAGEQGENRAHRGARELRHLRGGLEIGQQLRIRLRGGRWIGGLWTWELSGGGRGGSWLELRPASILLPGARGEGALLPVLAAPALPVPTAHRAGGLRFQWRLLALLRLARLEELRAGGSAPGLPALPEERLLLEARELDLPVSAALELLRCWRAPGGWLLAAPGDRLELADRAAARLLEEGARLAVKPR